MSGNATNGLPADGRRRLAWYQGAFASLAIDQSTAEGITKREWTLTLPGQPPDVRPFWSIAALKADLKAIVDELRLANEAKQAQQAAPEEAPQFVWPVVRFDEPFLSAESARVSVVATFLREEDALRFAEKREDLAVLPNAFKNVKPSDRLVAFYDPDPKSENAKKLNRIIQGGPSLETQREDPREASTKPDEMRPRAQSVQEADTDKSFRPVPVETPPTPSLEHRVWAVVQVIGTHGQDGALFKVVKLYDGRHRADMATWLSKEHAVFPRSFAAGEVGEGRWFAANNVDGYANDENAKKIRKLIEAERARNPLPKPPNLEPERRQQPGNQPDH